MGGFVQVVLTAPIKAHREETEMHPKDWTTYFTGEISPAVLEEMNQRRRAHAEALAGLGQALPEGYGDARMSPFAAFARNLTSPAIRAMKSF